MFTTLNGTVFICELPFIFYFVWFVFLVCVYYVYLYMGQVPELKLMMMMMMMMMIRPATTESHSDIKTGSKTSNEINVLDCQQLVQGNTGARLIGNLITTDYI